MHTRSPRIAVALAAALSILYPCTAVVAQTVPPAHTDTSAEGTISGTITDARNAPIGGATVSVSGSEEKTVMTGADGTFTMALAPGSYDMIVRKGGYTPAAALGIVVDGGGVKVVALSMTYANLSSVSVGRATTTGSAPPNTSASALSTLSNDVIARQPSVDLRNFATQLPGATLAHPIGDVPDSSFVIRGGTIETRVQIDGHPISAGATGRWNTSYASFPLFDSLEIVKGAGISGANAGESAFGTVNLRTRDFTRTNRTDVVVGSDDRGGQYSTVALSGNALTNDRLSYVLEHNIYGYNGPGSGMSVANVVPNPDGTAVLANFEPLDSPLVLGSDLAKLRYRFKGSTSLTLGYIGIHGTYGEAAGAFGTYDGKRTIVASTTNSNGVVVTSPLYANLIGKTIDTYTFSQNTNVQTNQPLFEAELRTAIGNDTLLVRPYGGNIFNSVDGTRRHFGPDTTSGSSWMAVTTGNGCSAAQPCIVPFSGQDEAQQELDRLHGTTLTWIHPYGDATLNLSYDYRSDETELSSGNPARAQDGTLGAVTGYLPEITPTLARYYDWSATTTLPLTSKLGLVLGNYYTGWNLGFGTTVLSVSDVKNTFSEVTTPANRKYGHDDTHLGLTWQAGHNTSVRFSGGSSITLPYALLVSGPVLLQNFLSPQGVVVNKNPDLRPETTVAYDLGVDHRLSNGTVVAIDGFDNTIHDVFASNVRQWDPSFFGLGVNPISLTYFGKMTFPVNAPIERNYGMELSISHVRTTGFGYRAAATFQRAYLDQLPSSFFTAPSSLINGKQLDGDQSIPYTQAYGEVTYQGRHGLGGSFGAQLTGTNNWTNGPGFTTFMSSLHYDLTPTYSLQLSAENLFNQMSGTQIASGVLNGGFSSVTYGVQTAGALPSYGSTSTNRYAIAPRTFRLQLHARVGN